MTAVAVSDYRGTDPDRGRGQGLAWRARQPLVPVVKAGLRSWGVATASRRPLPDFLVIGAKRGGSTSLFRNLLRTRGVLPLFPAAADIKGTYFFDVEYERSEAWYRSHFPTAGNRRRAATAAGPALAGEASPYYLAHPHAAARAAALVPDARIVVALRHPVARAYSHYQERVRQGLEPLTSFAEAVDAEPRRLSGELDRMARDPGYVSLAHLNHGYLAQSDYATGLGRWLDAFGTDQVLVVRSEDFYADEAAVLDQVRRFLGLAPAHLDQPVHFNATGSDDLDPALAGRLWDRVAPSVERLESRLDRSLGWGPGRH